MIEIKNIADIVDGFSILIEDCYKQNQSAIALIFLRDGIVEYTKNLNEKLSNQRMINQDLVEECDKLLNENRTLLRQLRRYEHD